VTPIHCRAFRPSRERLLTTPFGTRRISKANQREIRLLRSKAAPLQMLAFFLRSLRFFCGYSFLARRRQERLHLGSRGISIGRPVAGGDNGGGGVSKSGDRLELIRGHARYFLGSFTCQLS